MARTHTKEVMQADVRFGAAPARGRLDHATLLGLFCGFGLLFAAMAVGGTPGAFVNLPALLIVIGGTFGVTTVCFSLRDIACTPAVVAKTLFRSVPEADVEARRMLLLADRARKEGILSLEGSLGDMANEPFVQKAVALAVDGTPVEEIQHVLQRAIDEMIQRHLKSAGVLRKAAEVAPAMGLIGTLIGLVQMLGNLEDPAAIGPGMAIALLTTFYGAVLSNMMFSPLATKLERNSAEESLVANLYMLAAGSICRKENPRRLEMLFNAMLPPARQIQFFS